MKILFISDEECPALWDFYVPGRLDGIDLIISCGDLRSSYLQFLVTMARCPLLFVAGNHDTHYDREPPSGCDCIDDAIVEYNGVRIMGLGGCRRYHPGKYQYTEQQMRRRIRKLRLPLRRCKGVDIVVTHAPPEGLGDGEDPAHWGFASLRELLENITPATWCMGMCTCATMLPSSGCGIITAPPSSMPLSAMCWRSRTAPSGRSTRTSCAGEPSTGIPPMTGPRPCA